MTISLKLIDTLPDIINKINQALAKEINILISKRKSLINNKFKPSIKKWILNQPEIQSLRSVGVQGSLAALFGLTTINADEAISKIINAVIDSSYIDFSKINNNLTGNIIFNFQPSDFANLLSLSEGHRTTNKGSDLHWLDWLLTKGNTTIIINYHYEPSNKGIAKGGTMTTGGSFRVDPQFAGTLDNNFITRAFNGREKEVENILRGLLQ